MGDVISVMINVPTTQVRSQLQSSLSLGCGVIGRIFQLQHGHDGVPSTAADSLSNVSTSQSFPLCCFKHRISITHKLSRPGFRVMLVRTISAIVLTVSG